MNYSISKIRKKNPGIQFLKYLDRFVLHSKIFVVFRDLITKKKTHTVRVDNQFNQYLSLKTRLKKKKNILCYLNIVM